MIFNVAEKPSVARELSHVLSRGTATCENTSPHKYCKNYSINNGILPLLNGSIVTSVMGHITDIDFVSGYEQWHLHTLTELFHAPEARDIVTNLQSLSRRCSSLFIWTDCDLEGEYIAWEISQVCQNANTRLSVFRLRYSSLDAHDLLSAINSRGEIRKTMVEAVKTRRELDLRFGAIFTRLQTLKASDLFGSQRAILSYGPCQFPTMGFVVEQYKRHINHSATLKWNIKVNGTYKRRKFECNWMRGPLYDKPICYLYYISLDSDCLLVESIQMKPVSKRKPLPLRTVEFQKFLTKYLKISSDKLMKIAEELYLKGFISYPRTETDMYDSSFDFSRILEGLQGDVELGSHIGVLLQNGISRPRSGNHNDKSHPPIHPLKTGGNLSGESKRVYEYILRRFVASCMEDAKGVNTEVRFRIKAEIFKAASLEVIELNYLNVFIYDKWNESLLPAFSVGDQITNWQANLTESSVNPPELLTESGLISCMDRNQIGTDATIHEHIQKVLERRYIVEIKGKKLVPSVLGLKLAEFYDSFADMTSLTKPQLRASFEKKLHSIVEGSIPHTEVNMMYLNLYQQVFNLVQPRFEVFIRDIRSTVLPTPAVESEVDAVGTPRCTCGLIARKSVARTERNMGREFYSCTRETRRCDFFHWV